MVVHTDIYHFDQRQKSRYPKQSQALVISTEGRNLVAASWFGLSDTRFGRNDNLFRVRLVINHESETQQV